MMSAPLQYASCYVLDLYCRHRDGPIHTARGINSFDQYSGENFTECARKAREDGWKIKRSDRTATCPQCVRAGEP